MNQEPEKTLQERGLHNADLLRWLIKNSGLRVEEIALRAETTVRTVYRAQSGLGIQNSTLFKFAEVLNAKPEYLFNRELPESQYHRAIRKDAKSTDSSVTDRPRRVGDSGRSKSSVKSKAA